MTSALRATGSTRRWRRIRAGVLLRDGGRCRYCGGRADTVDHVTRREHGGDDRPSNLVACCATCQTPARRAFFVSGGGAGHRPLSVSLPRDVSATLLSGDYGRRR